MYLDPIARDGHLKLDMYDDGLKNGKTIRIAKIQLEQVERDDREDIRGRVGCVVCRLDF
jgi:hypothetical protein